MIESVLFCKLFVNSHKFYNFTICYRFDLFKDL